MRTPLRRKILLYSSFLLISLIVAMLVFVNFSAGRFVNSRIRVDLINGREVVKTAEQKRLDNLALAATALAALPNYFALLEGTKGDTATIRDYLNDFSQRLGTDLFIALDKGGKVLGRTDVSDPLPIDTNPDSAILQTPSGTYHVAVVPVDSTGETYGYLLAGALIDDKFARELKGNSDDDVVIVGDTILGSTLSRSSLMWQKREEWEQAVGADTDPRNVEAGGEDYLAAGTSLKGSGSRPFVVLMQSQTRAMKPYDDIQFGLLILGIIAAAAGVASSAVLARNITAPVAKLVEGTRQVALGNFDYRLDTHGTDEIGDLAESFNAMNQGLRERADMKKFVSMSTVEMIESASTRKTSAGEKVVLTVFFSDMRGFTSMSENQAPEETVKMLNACLSLQAARVKKFHGDIDKYVGDCVVALFSGDDMELNAIRCALETHRALLDLNAEKGYQPPLCVGIGIVTGEVILGSIGSEDRLDYTVIGSNVNLCSRLCSHAAAGETLIGESTYKRVEGLIAAEKAAPLQVKGFTDPIPVYSMR